MQQPGRARLAVAAAAWLGGCSLSCVDSSTRRKPGAVCEVAAPTPYGGDAVIPSGDAAVGGPYRWRNAAIKGGGFVSGIVVSPALPGLMFARTDVGGAYRFDPTMRRWMPMTDWVGRPDVNLTGIESIAADPTDPTRVYLAAGMYLTAGNGAILSSTDMGQTWARHSISAPMGGNVDGRSMGERLVVDPSLPSTLYFGSRNAGLWKSTDFAETWTQVTTFPTSATNNGAGAGFGLTFVAFDRSTAAAGAETPAIYVGAGVTTGTGLYRSTDAGMTWEAVTGQPVGMMPHHAVADGCGNLYFAYNSGQAPNFGAGPNDISDGAIWRYTVATGAWQNVSPLPHLGGGFGGLAVDVAHPGTLMVSTMDFWSPGEIYRTTDGARSWSRLLPNARRDVAGATWLWWHGSNLPALGWMGDIEIDPFDPARALFITGQGIWSSGDVTASDSRAATHWTFEDDGLEETVVLDLVSPPSGASLLSGVGDIGGFRHDDLDVSPANGMFSNPIFGNTTSLDFAETAPNIVARVGTISSNGGAPAAGAYSMDGGASWTAFAGLPPLPTVAAGAKPPVPASGSIAVSADGAALVWAPQPARGAPAIMPAYSRDLGKTWTSCAGLPAGARVASDRVNAMKFYASGGNRMYASSDGGATFAPVTAPSTGRPRPVFGVEGDVWAATGAGLIHSQDSGASWGPVPQVDGATAVGFGAAAAGHQYPAVYLAGSVNGVWGTHRSDDGGVSWQRVDDPQHQFGFINCLSGDPRHYGRVYLGTGGRGIVYGDPN